MASFAHAPHELFQALSIDIRLRILCLLQVGDLCVCDIVEILDLPQPTISRHLLMLKQWGLIRAEREKNWVIYSLAPSADPIWLKQQGVLAALRTSSPQLIADAKTARSKSRPACPQE
jgi:ArsR family transcriptional regulator